MMEYRITHTTLYTYGEPVSLCHNRTQLKPLSMLGQECREFTMSVEPSPSHMDEFEDYFGNSVHYFEIHEPHETLKITAKSRVVVLHEVQPLPPANLSWDGESLGQGDECQRVFAHDSPMIRTGADLAEFARLEFTPGRPILDAAMGLTRRIHQTFRYDPQATTIATPIREVLEKQAGVCQDFSHLAIGALRSLGLMARYVSGYLETDPPPGMSRLEGADASHAWFSLCVPGYGWFDFDPTNGVSPSGRHIILALGRDYSDTPPVKGVVVGGREHTLSVAVDVLGNPAFLNHIER